MKGDDILKNENPWIIEKVTGSSQLGYRLKSKISNLYLKIQKNDDKLTTTNDFKRTMWRIQYPIEPEKNLIFMSHSKMAEKKLTIDLKMNQSFEDSTPEFIEKTWTIVKGTSHVVMCRVAKSRVRVLNFFSGRVLKFFSGWG